MVEDAEEAIRAYGIDCVIVANPDYSDRKREELRRICEKKVSAAELRRTKEFLVGNFRLSHERVTSKLFFYGQTLLAFGRLVTPEEQVEGIRVVTSADVQAAARSIFVPSARSISWVVPCGRGAAGEGVSAK